VHAGAVLHKDIARLLRINKLLRGCMELHALYQYIAQQLHDIIFVA
jgi:hypothetical protein